MLQLIRCGQPEFEHGLGGKDERILSLGGFQALGAEVFHVDVGAGVAEQAHSAQVQKNRSTLFAAVLNGAFHGTIAVGEIESVVARWPDYARATAVPADTVRAITTELATCRGELGD